MVGERCHLFAIQLVLGVASRLCARCSWMILVPLGFAQPLIWMIQHSRLDGWCCCLSVRCDPVVGTGQKINLLTKVVSDCKVLCTAHIFQILNIFKGKTNYAFWIQLRC